MHAITERTDLTDLEIVQEALKADYEVREEIGRGGMAMVFRARERELKRDVAIKVLPFSHSHDKNLVERFAIGLAARATSSTSPCGFSGDQPWPISSSTPPSIRGTSVGS
jgi:serine/threonine protein kinase